MQNPQLPEDPRFATMVARVTNREATDTVVGELFASLTRDQLIARLDKADIAYGEVNSAQDLSAHPHLRRIEVDSPGGRIAMPAPAPIVIGESRSYGAVPAAGVDTATFLKQSGSIS